MKIVQITDLHIDEKGEFPFDIDVRKNFTNILRATRDIEPDHLVVSGDLCYRTGEKSIYKWVKNRLDLQDIPYSIIAGNHDDSVLMAEVFQLQHLLNEQELYFAKKIGKTSCLFLDTARGFHSERQLNWLKRQLKNSKEELIIFMAPEGTRRKVDKIKTGFYYIARGAKIPIVMIRLDFAEKDLKFSAPFYPTDDKDADFEKIYGFFKGVVGKNKAWSWQN